MSLLFSENKLKWTPIPKWAEFMIKLGCSFSLKAEKNKKRISIISMPCESPSAGLVALGALIGDLGKEDANDVDAHFEKIASYGIQYLESCKKCTNVCYPEIQNCGYQKYSTGELRSPFLNREKVKITNVLKDSIQWRKKTKRRNGEQMYAIVTANRAKIIKYHIEDEPPVLWAESMKKLPHHIYNELLTGTSFLAKNLSTTYSGLCFAGRVGGEKASFEICSSVHLRYGHEEFPLSEVMSISAWTKETVSRMSYLNTRTMELDRKVGCPHLVVADGSSAFLKAIDYPEFRNSNILAVIKRTDTRTNHDLVSLKLASIRQWYAMENNILEESITIPKGITMTTFLRINKE
jgi:hypothetical protein